MTCTPNPASSQEWWEGGHRATRPRYNQHHTHKHDRNRGCPDKRTTTHAPREAARSEQMAGSSRTRREDGCRVRTMAYIAPQNLTWAIADTAQSSPAENRRGQHLRKPRIPRSQHNTFKKGTMPKRHRWPVRQSGPRVSPGTNGRNGPTQEHASKEEVAPADVTEICNGNAEQGFHPGRKSHHGKTDTSSGK
jgi:hypothetical protein